MRTITFIQFDNQYYELLIFERMTAGLNAAFPDAEWINKSGKRIAVNEDAEAQKLLGRLAKRGDTYAHEELEQAHGFLTTMVERLSVQADREHWASQVQVVPREVPSDKLPFITDPDMLIDTLVQTRTRFRDDARRALQVIEYALPWTTNRRGESVQTAAEVDDATFETLAEKLPWLKGM